jgi:hypothetical protein
VPPEFARFLRLSNRSRAEAWSSWLLVKRRVGAAERRWPAPPTDGVVADRASCVPIGYARFTPAPKPASRLADKSSQAQITGEERMTAIVTGSSLGLNNSS